MIAAFVLSAGRGSALTTCEESERQPGLAGFHTARNGGFQVKELHHRIAVNRRFYPYITGHPVNASFSLEANERDRPISHPLEIEDSDLSSYSEKRSAGTWFAPGDGSATATWTWEDSRLPGCVRTFSYMLHPFPGRRPAIEVKLEEGDAQFLSLNEREGNCEFENMPGGEILQFGRGRGSQKMTMSDVCDPSFAPKELETPDWLAFDDYTAVQFKPRFDQPGSHRVGYQVRFRGKVFASGLLHIVTHGRSSRVTSITTGH